MVLVPTHHKESGQTNSLAHSLVVLPDIFSCIALDTERERENEWCERKNSSFMGPQPSAKPLGSVSHPSYALLGPLQKAESVCPRGDEIPHGTQRIWRIAKQDVSWRKHGPDEEEAQVQFISQ